MLEVIILAGGLGTRLRSAVPDLPKCMAPVNGRPFIDYVVDSFVKQGVQHFIFSLGYMHEVLEQHLEEKYPELQKKYVIETEPLGTGGGIQKACSVASFKNVIIANGDTLFNVDVNEIIAAHEKLQSNCTLSLKPMENFDRYGVVEIDENQQITSFKEKKHYEKGLINGGVYTLRVDTFLAQNLPEKFSFEKEYLEALFTKIKMCGVVQTGYFIDIGIPEDFAKANREL